MKLQMPDAVHQVAEAYKHDLLVKRDDTLCEVLSMITEKLDPTGDTSRQMVLVEVLRSVNAMRSDDKPQSGNDAERKNDDDSKK